LLEFSLRFINLFKREFNLGLEKKSLYLSAISILLISASLQGQICFKPKPFPECNKFFITEFGILLNINSIEASAREQILNWELGLMGNISRKSAVGGSLYASYSKNAELYGGFKMGYRRWLNSSFNVEAEAGPIWRLGYIESRTFFSFNLGLNYRDLALFLFQIDFFEEPIVSIGIKFGTWPGTILGVLAAGVTGVRYLLRIID